jgi:hypothetical protein
MLSRSHYNEALVVQDASNLTAVAHRFTTYIEFVEQHVRVASRIVGIRRRRGSCGSLLRRFLLRCRKFVKAVRMRASWWIQSSCVRRTSCGGLW